VQAAVRAGTVEAARVERWKKLHAENSEHSAASRDRRRRGTAQAPRLKPAKPGRRPG
jgi:hypothetical protein